MLPLVEISDDYCAQFNLKSHLLSFSMMDFLLTCGYFFDTFKWLRRFSLGYRHATSKEREENSHEMPLLPGTGK